jgi:hypothetical protein
MSMSNLSDYENDRLYASSTVLNKEKTRIAQATYMADMIDIFDLTDSQIRNVWSHQGFLPHDYNVFQMGSMDRAAATDKSQYGYADIASSNKYIYTIYSGRLLKDKNYSYGNIIRIVSWDGKKSLNYIQT